MSIYKQKISLYKTKFDGNHCFIRKCYNIAQQNTVHEMPGFQKRDCDSGKRKSVISANEFLTKTTETEF